MPECDARALLCWFSDYKPRTKRNGIKGGSSKKRLAYNQVAIITGQLVSATNAGYIYVGRRGGFEIKNADVCDGGRR